MLDHAVVGFLTLQRQFDQAAEITWMAVHARHRHHGVGRALIERLCQDLAAEGRRLLLVLTVSPSDPGEEEEPPDGYQATRAFYQAMGFILARDLPNLWSNTSPSCSSNHSPKPAEHTGTQLRRASTGLGGSRLRPHRTSRIPGRAST
jgi:ribosomal protein S18 acetylase RimI-like enzyme